MQTLSTLSAAEIEQLVQDLGTPVSATLAMPKQLLETADTPLLRRALRAVQALLHLGPAPHQEM
ncbi:hypothetical protein SAMN04488103_1219 [Gemmobacter aquatilis]|uniref:Uncharacterized protein n=2 Tax=Gemmobacter aquatilis TaxID=933059 RepID=A0A1H8NM54_9RHOB|nr:hypothetical protein SAMN04488103_1219 [Gemmobacter aquatilis]